MKSDLRTAFPTGDPANDILLPSGKKVCMRPVPMKQFPRFMSALVKMGSSVSTDASQLNLAVQNINEEFMSLIMESIDLKEEDLTLADASVLLERFMEINFPGDSWGNWHRLVRQQLGTPRKPDVATRGVSKK